MIRSAHYRIRPGCAAPAGTRSGGMIDIDMREVAVLAEEFEQREVAFFIRVVLDATLAQELKLVQAEQVYLIVGDLAVLVKAQDVQEGTNGRA